MWLTCSFWRPKSSSSQCLACLSVRKDLLVASFDMVCWTRSEMEEDENGCKQRWKCITTVTALGLFVSICVLTQQGKACPTLHYPNKISRTHTLPLGKTKWPNTRVAVGWQTRPRSPQRSTFPKRHAMDSPKKEGVVKWCGRGVRDRPASTCRTGSWPFPPRPRQWTHRSLSAVPVVGSCLDCTLLMCDVLDPSVQRRNHLMNPTMMTRRFSASSFSLST